MRSVIKGVKSKLMATNSIDKIKVKHIIVHFYKIECYIFKTQKKIPPLIHII